MLGHNEISADSRVNVGAGAGPAEAGPGVENIGQDPDPLQQTKKSQDIKECVPVPASENAANKIVGRQDQNRHVKRKFDEMDEGLAVSASKKFRKKNRRSNSEAKLNVDVVVTVQEKEPRNSCNKTLIDLTLDSEDEAVDEVPAKKIKGTNSDSSKKLDSSACRKANFSEIEEKLKLNEIDLPLYSNKKVNDKPFRSSISNKSCSKAKKESEIKRSAFDVGSSDSRAVSKLERNNRKIISHHNTYVSEKRILKRIKKLIDFDDDSDSASGLDVQKTCKMHHSSGLDVQKTCKTKYISEKRILKRIKKLIDFDDDSANASSLEMEKTCKTKYISEKRILKRIKKTIGSEMSSDDDQLNTNTSAKEESVQIKDSQIINEEDVFDIAKIKNSSKKTIELRIEHQEFQDKIPDAELGDMDIDAAGDANNLSCTLKSIIEKNNSPSKDACTYTKTICDNENTEDKCKNIEQEESTSTNNNHIRQCTNNERSNFSINKISNEELSNISDAELSDVDIDVGSEVDNLSCARQLIKEKNNSPSKDACTYTKTLEKNLNDIFSKDLSDVCNLTDVICDNENTEDKRKNIEQEKSPSTNNDDNLHFTDNPINQIPNGILSDIEIDVVGISDDSNSASRLIAGQNQFEEKNNSLSKTDFSNLNLGNSSNNKDDLQCKENISMPLNDVLDNNMENGKNNLNFSKSTLTQNQVEKKTRSPVSQSHWSNDGSSSKLHICNNSFEKQLNGPLSEGQSNDNILTDTVSKNENINEKYNKYSARNIELPIMRECWVLVSKINTEPKNTDLTVKSPQAILPMVANSYGQRIFRFFWLDAFEDSYTDPGVVFLFGKVLEPTSNQKISSCCVTVKNIPRRIYVLPRRNEDGEQSSFDEVYQELNEYTRKKGINEFKCKEVQKTYAFEKKDVPQNTKYIEVRYSAAYPALDSNYSGPAIQAIFGTNVTAMELFLIEKNIHGPCWMDVKVSPSASSNLSSWCKFEINSARMEDISVTKHQQKDPGITPIAVAALSIQVFLDEKLQKYDIASVGISIQERFHLDKGTPKPLFDRSYCLVSQCIPWPKFAHRRFSKWKDAKVILCETETNLLEELLQLFQYLDPDILIGYDTDFEFDILVRKILSLGIKDWSRIGKLRRSVPPKFKGKIYFNQILCGRPICDIQTSMNEFQLRAMNCDLASLYSLVLSKEIGAYKEIKPDECLQYYNSIYSIELLVTSTTTKASYILELSSELNILSLAVQITRIVGNTLSRTLSCGVGERNEFLLLHEFQSNNYLTPDKRKDKSDMYDGKKKSSYTGGVILDPKAGFYDTLVLLLDFNSLYPSIIQEFNICFTTIPGAAHASVNELSRVESHVEQGILPTVINRLVQSRLQIKKMMNSPNLSPDLRRQYNSRQLALKLTANSMYGCLGASYSRFYAKGLAALVAMRGREIFQKTKDLIQSHNYEVIYGDTDSFMINVRLTDYEQVMAVGRTLKREVNKLFKKVKIDIDRVFKCLLLMKKKQYAGLTITRLPNGELEYKKEIKGLEIIRRDCCAIASDAGNKVLEELLKDQPSDVRLKNVFEILETTSKELREGKLPLSSLEITKTLSKDPDKYTNKNHPHVIVAERLNKINARQWKAGDVISYIICEDNTAKKPLERAYHVEEFKTNSEIKIDVTYYLLHQVFPIILKICDPIEGLEDVLIAQSLGISDFYKPKQINEDRERKVPLSLRNNRHKNCVPLKFNCRDCKTENEIRTSVINTKDGCRPSLAMCSNSKCDTPPWKYPYLIQNKLQLAIRQCIGKYYAGETECCNPLCCNSTRSIHLDLSDGIITCYDCFDGKRYRKYTEIDLHNQLTFFVNIFTLDQAACQSLDLFTSQEIMDVYTGLREFMLDQIDSNAYSVVDLSKLFCSNLESRKDDDLGSDLM